MTITPARHVNIHTSFQQYFKLYFSSQNIVMIERKNPSVHVSLLHSNSLHFYQLYLGSVALQLHSLRLFFYNQPL